MLCRHILRRLVEIYVLEYIVIDKPGTVWSG